MLLKAGKKEPAGPARCISLPSLGILVYREPVQKSHHPNLLEVVTAPLFQSSSSSSTGSRFFPLALFSYSACLFDYLASMSKILKCVTSGDIVTMTRLTP